MKEVNITVVREPVSVEFRCPHCRSLNYIDFTEFAASQDDSEPESWISEIMNCEDCLEEIEISGIYYD